MQKLETQPRRLMLMYYQMGLNLNSSVSATALNSFQLVTTSPEETQQLGKRLGELAAPGQVIALQGELGSGKTRFVKGLARGLGVREPVHSPTFILANEHRSGRLPLFHVDLYRVATADEALGFGLEDYLGDVGVTAIEWAEKIQAALPFDRLWIEFRHAGDQTRELRLSAQGEQSERLLARLRERLRS